jgi:hypothetical protein
VEEEATGISIHCQRGCSTTQLVVSSQWLTYAQHDSTVTHRGVKQRVDPVDCLLPVGPYQLEWVHQHQLIRGMRRQQLTTCCCWCCYQQGSAQSTLINFRGGDIPTFSTNDPINNTTDVSQPAASADACCRLCEAQTQPQCERWTYVIPYGVDGQSTPGKCYLKSDAIGASIAVPTAYNTAAAAAEADKQLVYTSGVLTGARMPRSWQGLLRNHSRNDCKPTGPIGESRRSVFDALLAIRLSPSVVRMDKLQVPRPFKVLVDWRRCQASWFLTLSS